MNINLESLRKTHKDEAVRVYQEIAKLVGGDPDTTFVGGIDLTNATAAHKAQVDRILNAETADAKADAKTKTDADAKADVGKEGNK